MVKRPESRGTRVIPMRATPPPAISCFIEAFIMVRYAITVPLYGLQSEHPALSYGTRLYLHPQSIIYALWSKPLRAARLYSRHGIVVEPCSVRALAADCPLLSVFRLTPCTIRMLFSAFAAFASEHISSLCCSASGFRVFQQFSLLMKGITPFTAR